MLRSITEAGSLVPFGDTNGKATSVGDISIVWGDGGDDEMLGRLRGGGCMTVGCSGSSSEPRCTITVEGGYVCGCPSDAMGCCKIREGGADSGRKTLGSKGSPVPRQIMSKVLPRWMVIRPRYPAAGWMVGLEG